MPKDDVKLTDKYEEDPIEKGVNYEQKKWEEGHLGAALMRFGAKDAKSKSKQKEYDVIMDEEIEFVQVLQMPGTRKSKVCVYIFFFIF